MPSKSKAQHNFMGKAAHDLKFAKRHGISQGTAREFLTADRGTMKGKPEHVDEPLGKSTRRRVREDY